MTDKLDPFAAGAEAEATKELLRDLIRDEMKVEVNFDGGNRRILKLMLGEYVISETRFDVTPRNGL